MSDCGVCLSSDYSACYEMIESVEIVALESDKQCCECCRVIKAGTPLEVASWYEDYDEDDDGDDDGEELREAEESIYTCVVCAEIANAFYCGGDGRIYGGDFWEAMSEADVWPNLTTSCFDKLTTPEAKAELRRRWMEWKGLA